MQQSSKRPLSPHIQIYKWQWTMLYSIFHRATGIALTSGILLLSAWITALFMGETSYNHFMEYVLSPLGYIVMIGFTWAMSYHLLNGIRHLLWDMGIGLTLETGHKTGHLFSMTGSIIVTIFLWIMIF